MSEYDDEVIVEDETLEGDENLEDNPLFSVLNDDPSTDDDGNDDDYEDDEFEPEEGDSPEVLRTKLKAKSRMLRQKGKSNARLKDRVDELEGLVKNGKNGMDKNDIAELIAAVKGDEDTSEQDEAERLQALKDKIDEDPSNVVEILLENNRSLENKLARILQSRDSYIEEKLANAKSEQSAAKASPEVMRVVGMLKQNAKYKDVDEATLIGFAEDLAPMASRVKRPPASTSTRSTSLPVTATNKQVESRFSSELDAMGYGSEND